MTAKHTGPNAETLDAWDGAMFEKFFRFRHLVGVGLGGHSAIAMQRHAPPPGGRCLDLGCGFGDTTLELAAKVGGDGWAVGQDGSTRMLEVARADGEKAHARNVRWLLGDAQTMDLGGPYDYAFSRMGVMFFADPVAAFRNIHRAMAPDGELCWVVWRRRDDNAFIAEADKVIRPLFPDAPQKPPAGPGPFSMVDTDVTSEQLQAAGFRRVSFDRVDHPICIGRDLDEAVQFGATMGPGGELLRLAGDAAATLRPRVEALLRELFARYTKADGVFAPSSSWTITART